MDFIIEKPPELFLKGVESSDDRHRRSGRNTNSLSLNILKPSLARPDLSRAHAELTSVNLDDAWRDFASRIRDTIGPHSPSIEDRVRVLAAAKHLAHLPDGALSQLIEQDRWPIWSLEPNSGLSWHDARATFSVDEIIEAPDEFQYIIGSSVLRHQAAVRNAAHWSGRPCFVTPRGSADPWWVVAASLAPFLLEARGFAPVEVRFVSSPSDDDVPLITPVWRKQTAHARPPGGLGLPALLDEWHKDPLMECPDLIRRALGSMNRHGADAPLLVRFPKGMQEVAAIGSLYWNQSNTKIQALLEMLLELSVRGLTGSLSARTQRIVDYVNDTSYLDYRVPARHSNLRTAIDRYRELVTAAREEHLVVPEPLCKEDFLEGSVGKYWNPYHYPIESWSKSKRAVGVPLD